MDKALLKQITERYETATFTVHRRLSALIREKMPEGLTLEQYSTLRYICVHGTCTSSELADAFCVGKSSITAIITRLSDKQLIKRTPDEKDRRVIYLALTPEGIMISNEMDEQIQELLGHFINNFEDQEALAFIETYEKLAKLLL